MSSGGNDAEKCPATDLGAAWMTSHFSPRGRCRHESRCRRPHPPPRGAGAAPSAFADILTAACGSTCPLRTPPDQAPALLLRQLPSPSPPPGGHALPQDRRRPCSATPRASIAAPLYVEQGRRSTGHLHRRRYWVVGLARWAPRIHGSRHRCCPRHLREPHHRRCLRGSPQRRRRRLCHEDFVMLLESIEQTVAYSTVPSSLHPHRQMWLA